MFSIQTTYPDRICYRPECEVHECPVLLPEGVQIAWQRVSPEGIWMKLRRIAMRAPCHQEEGSLHLVHVDGPPCDVRISHSRNSIMSDMSGSSDSAYPESFSLNIQYRGVLLKLPDMCDRHFEIFCFRYLMSKSPNSL